jgi:hypothetical protein
MKLKIYFCLILAMWFADENAIAFYYGDVGQPHPNEVHVGKSAIVMPLDYILLVRRNQEYCAIRFTKKWTENRSEDRSTFVASGSDEFATYDSWYQEDKSGNFSKKQGEFKTGKLSLPKPRGIGRLAFSFGKKEIECGPIRLLWSGNGSVHFYMEGQKQGNYGIELAPTPWTDISEVNFKDPRIKWYSYNASRKRLNIPIDKFWE